MATTTPTASATAFKPDKPTMGDLVQLSEKTIDAWTGGKPKADWSGLHDSNAMYVNPNQLRPTYASEAQKSYNRRGQGPEVKFKKGDDLADFILSFWDMLVDRGMDTIAYLPDPEDAQRMTNVVECHARFTLDSASDKGRILAAKFDKYDKNNDSASKHLLLDSLDPTLAKDIRVSLESDALFVEAWMEFIDTCQSTSIDRFEKHKSSIRAVSPFKISGENVEEMAKLYRQHAIELDKVGQYDHNLTKVMLDTFILAGGTNIDADDYRFELRSLATTLNAALLHIGFISKIDAKKYMKTNKLLWRDVCTKAVRLYRQKFDNNKWHPAKNARDSKAPPTNFGALAASALAASTSGAPITPELLTMLLQAQGSHGNKGTSGGAKGNCYGCGKPGHMKRDCPENKSGGGGRGNGGNRQNGGGRGYKGRQNDRGGSGQRSWRNTPPAPGAPTFTMRNGKRFDWCAKCNRYTCTHTTDTHTGGANKSTPDAQPMAGLSLVPDPSAWMATSSFSFF